jgi:hypothetical protein
MYTLQKIKVFGANVHIFKQLKKNKQKKVLFITILKQKIGVLANIFSIFENESKIKRAAYYGCSKIMQELNNQKLSRSLSRKYLKVPTVSSSQAASSQTTMAAGWV